MRRKIDHILYHYAVKLKFNRLSETGATIQSILPGLAVALLAFAPQFAAADYPEKPIRFIVPYAAGGTTDLLSRAIAQELSEAWARA